MLRRPRRSESCWPIVDLRWRTRHCRRVAATRRRRPATSSGGRISEMTSRPLRCSRPSSDLFRNKNQRFGPIPVCNRILGLKVKLFLIGLNKLIMIIKYRLMYINLVSREPELEIRKVTIESGIEYEPGIRKKVNLISLTRNFI